MSLLGAWKKLKNETPPVQEKKIQDLLTDARDSAKNKYSRFHNFVKKNSSGICMWSCYDTSMSLLGLQSKTISRIFTPQALKFHVGFFGAMALLTFPEMRRQYKQSGLNKYEFGLNKFFAIPRAIVSKIPGLRKEKCFNRNENEQGILVGRMLQTCENACKKIGKNIKKRSIESIQVRPFAK